MQKIPMQIYVDQESVEFYKNYAAKRAISFAAAIREALKDKQESLLRVTIHKKATHPLLTAIANAQAALSGVTYHHPNKQDDELIYG